MSNPPRRAPRGGSHNTAIQKSGPSIRGGRPPRPGTAGSTTTTAGGRGGGYQRQTAASHSRHHPQQQYRRQTAQQEYDYEEDEDDHQQGRTPSAEPESEVPVPTPAPAPRINYAEELDKTEQSITLALQEIDLNFAKAHKIVTSTIVPVIERYGAESRRVWQGAEFWKRFLEASANVSLSGYEEIAAPDGGVDDSQAQGQDHDASAAAHEQQHGGYEPQTMPLQYEESTVKIEDSTTAGPGDEQHNYDARTPQGNVLGPLETPGVASSRGAGQASQVKKEPGTTTDQPSFDDDTGLPDPPSATTRIFMPNSTSRPAGDPSTAGGGTGGGTRNNQGLMLPPRTPLTRHADNSYDFNSVASSPFNSKLDILPGGGGVGGDSRYQESPSMNRDHSTLAATTTPGVLRHRVLDKNWRVQMTPGVQHEGSAVSGSPSKANPSGAGAGAGGRTPGRTPARLRGVTPHKDQSAAEAKKQSFASRFDSSPLDGLEPPQLQTDIQFSPTPKSSLPTTFSTSAGASAATTAPGSAVPKSRFLTPRKTGSAFDTAAAAAPKTPIQRFYAFSNELSDSSFGGSNASQSGADTTMRTPGAAGTNAGVGANNNSFFDDDDDDSTSMNFGMSPPVTMNFTVPAPSGSGSGGSGSGNLQRTPAREAAQNMVQDILKGADADNNMELDD